MTSTPSPVSPAPAAPSCAQLSPRHQESLRQRGLRASLRAASVFLVLALVASCNKPQAQTRPDGKVQAWVSPAVASTELDPAQVVATIGGKDIDAEELDKLLADQLKEAASEYSNAVYTLRRESLEQIVAERLIGLAAEEKGLSAEDYFEQEVINQVPPVSDEEMQEIYETQVKPRYNLPFEAVAPQLRMQIQQEAMANKGRELVDELRKKYGVKISLPAPQAEKVDVAATGPSRGPESAPVTIVIFSDFECPFCSRANPSLDQVVEQYGDQVRLVFRHFPLSFHPHAEKAAEASLCADDQGKFWEMHDLLFARQKNLEDEDLKDYAEELGLDTEAFDNCLDSGAKSEQVAKDFADGQEAGVRGTPAFFINGRFLSGAQPFEQFKQLIDAELGE